MTDMISTHAPLAGRDRQQLVKRVEKRISTHAPLAGRDDSAKVASASLF